MKYMIMLSGSQNAYEAMSGRAVAGHPAWSEADRQAMFAHMGALNDDLVASGELVDARGLAEPNLAQRVTAAPDGSPVVANGAPEPSAEVLAGYWIVDVAGLERAYEIAARAHRCPVPEGSPAGAPLIVRPVAEPDR